MSYKQAHDNKMHRMQSMNEQSARYTELPAEFYIPIVWRAQDTKNKQGSVKSNELNHSDLTKKLEDHCDASYKLYESMLTDGVARELARMVLPVNIYTELYATWDLKNLLHFISLRDDPHAQFEIQEYARAIKEILKELFPWTIEAFDKYKFKLTK